MAGRSITQHPAKIRSRLTVMAACLVALGLLTSNARADQITDAKIVARPLGQGLHAVGVRFYVFRSSFAGGKLASTPPGTKVTIRVNLSDADPWPNADDPIGSGTIEVILPSPGQRTGPYELLIACDLWKLTGEERPDYRATFKDAEGIAGTTISTFQATETSKVEDLSKTVKLGNRENDVSMGRLAPSTAVQQSPSLMRHFGKSTAIVGLTSAGLLTFKLESAEGVPSVPRLPETGLPYEMYAARITDVYGNQVSFIFPTAERLNEADEKTRNTVRGAHGGFPVFEWADVSLLGKIASIQILLLDRERKLDPVPILERRLDARGTAPSP